MYCGEAILVNCQPGEHTAISLRCRAWTCPECSPQRSRELIAQAHAGAPDTFLTLTHRRRPGITANQAAAELARAWRLVRLRLMRLRKIKRLPFLAVVEATKLGWPHLHILLRSTWIDQRWLSEQMQEICGSPIVDIRRIDHGARVNAYVAKYAGKCAHKFGTTKRYWQSKDWQLPRTDASPPASVVRGTWGRQDVPLPRWIADFETFGWRVERPSHWRAVAYRPP